MKKNTEIFISEMDKERDIQDKEWNLCQKVDGEEGGVAAPAQMISARMSKTQIILLLKPTEITALTNLIPNIPPIRRLAEDHLPRELVSRNSGSMERVEKYQLFECKGNNEPIERRTLDSSFLTITVFSRPRGKLEWT